MIFQESCKCLMAVCRKFLAGNRGTVLSALSLFKAFLADITRRVQSNRELLVDQNQESLRSRWSTKLQNLKENVRRFSHGKSEIGCFRKEFAITTTFQA